MWNSGWDNVHRDKEWGRYPPEELVRFMGRNYATIKKTNRDEISVLEIGCGAGANLIFLAGEGFKVTGLDGSGEALKRSTSRLKELGLSARLDQGDAMALPYDDESFDCVLDIECIYANTIGDSRRILREVHRVLRSGGSFFSKTFMAGATWEKTGRRMDGEPNTFLEIPDGPFNRGYGIIRLTDEEEIPDIYDQFAEISFDFVIRSDQNRTKEVREWLITCRK